VRSKVIETVGGVVVRRPAGVAGKGCVVVAAVAAVDDVDDVARAEVVRDSQKKMCLSCRVMSGMDLWHKKKMAVTLLTGIAVVETPTEVSLQLVVVHASVVAGYATGYYKSKSDCVSQ
jgi:hypothetical protein